MFQFLLMQFLNNHLLIFTIGTDDDDTILKSFDAFEIGGKIDAEM